ncbi:MAG: PLP-dependent aminotransferase family protein [Dehalococcoidia bacterium]|nr:PLP-dependent aminotransferase family protein [Dehalococcoidia bacterium]
MATAAGNWESEQLENTLAKRVRSGWGAYWVASARQEPPPVPPIALTGGIPDPDTLPIEDLIEVSNRVLRREGPEALRYGGHQGYQGLREWLAEHYGRRERLQLSADNFTITNGVSGAVLNVCETFLDEGDVGLAESPTYPGGAGAIQHCLAELVSVPLDEHGLLPEALEETIERLEREGRRVKLLYTVPNFHNPTGTTLTLERRKEVVEICQRHGVLIVEDDAYGDVRFEAEPLPSLFALAGGKGAVYLGTFSKTVATGLRVGWALADEAVVEALLRTRFDLGTSPWLQRTMLEYAATGLWERHVVNVNEVYRRKRDVMLAALEERCGRYLSWNRPLGGYFLWLQLAEGVDPAALAEAARNHGVAYVGGAAFHRDGTGRHSIRLAFSFVNEQEIPEAVLRLGRALEEASHTSAS